MLQGVTPLEGGVGGGGDSVWVVYACVCVGVCWGFTYERAAGPWVAAGARDPGPQDGRRLQEDALPAEQRRPGPRPLHIPSPDDSAADVSFRKVGRVGFYGQVEGFGVQC